MALNRSIIQKVKKFWKQHKIKIASTLIAMFIWFLVVTRDSYEYETTIPIDIGQNNPDYVITSSLPEKAHVVVYGAGRYLLSYVLFREINLRLDLNWTSGRHIITPEIDDIFGSGNATNLKVTKYLGPDTIIVDIEKLVIKKIPVQNNIVIKPMASYTQVGDVIMEPDVVRVQGPEKALAGLDSIATPEKIIRDQKFPFHETFQLLPPDNELMKLLDTKVEIAVEIQQLLEKRITQIPISVRYLPHNLMANIQPEYVDITVQGGMNVVSTLKSKDIDAYVEYSPDLEQAEILYEPIKEVTFRDPSTDQVKVSFVQSSDE